MKVSEQIAIMKAYEDGKTIEQKRLDRSEWERSFDRNEWESIVYVEDFPFDFVMNEYRIKPEPKYRPYKSVEEAFAEAEKHGFWVKSKDKHSLFFIDSFEAAGNGNIYINHCHVGAFIEKFVWFDDNSTCGVEIE